MSYRKDRDALIAALKTALVALKEVNNHPISYDDDLVSEAISIVLAALASTQEAKTTASVATTTK